MNRPFEGALVPLENYRKEPRVTALMVEVNRGLYMDEATGQKLNAYAHVREQLAGALMALSAAIQNLGDGLGDIGN